MKNVTKDRNKKKKASLKVDMKWIFRVVKKFGIKKTE